MGKQVPISGSTMSLASAYRLLATPLPPLGGTDAADATAGISPARAAQMLDDALHVDTIAHFMSVWDALADVSTSDRARARALGERNRWLAIRPHGASAAVVADPVPHAVAAAPGPQQAMAAQPMVAGDAVAIEVGTPVEFDVAAEAVEPGTDASWEHEVRAYTLHAVNEAFGEVDAPIAA